MSVIERIKSLDALRGIAAVWVLLAHHFNAIHGFYSVADSWVRFTPLRLLTEARFPVILFFVLSGFVLAGQLMGERTLTYRGYVIRRVCRIYMPFAASIILSWALYNLIGDKNVIGAAPTINSDWTGSGSIGALGRHLAMLGRRMDTNLNGVVWSLVVELRISLLFPILVWVAIRSKAALFIFAAISFASYLSLVRYGQAGPIYTGNTIGLSFVATTYFLFPFAIGISVKQVWPRVPAASTKMAVFWGIVLLLCFLAVQRLGSPILKDFGYILLAGGLMLLILKSQLFNSGLDSPLIQWFGRVSYSLYLFHVIVLVALMKALSTQLSLIWLVSASLIISFVVAEIANRLIEQPSTKLGRLLSQRTDRPALPQHPAVFDTGRH